MKSKLKKFFTSKKFIIITSIILLLTLFCTFAMPYIILASVRQPEPEDHPYSEYFLTTYEEVRAHLADRVKALEESGVVVEHTNYAIDESDDLYIENIYLPATETCTNLIVLTTGVHGIEGYIGSAMLDVFFDRIYPTLDTKDTGVLVVANVNPYGMKYMRRYNENNVDLNRNFIADWSTFDRTSNKAYPQVKDFLQPTGPMGNAFWHETGFYLSLVKEAIFTGADTVSDALLTGQYEYPDGVYYGGNGDEKSTAYLKGVFNDCLESDYQNIIHVDIHSGYGPRYNMVIFNSLGDPTSEADSIAEIGYEYIIAQDSEDFYPTSGDTTNYFYTLAKNKNSDKTLYSTCFEFGTIGDDFFSSILSLKYTVDENRQYHYPTSDPITAEMVHQNHLELFYPTEAEWRMKTIVDFSAAFYGVLDAKLK